jgi:hypothetical protein
MVLSMACLAGLGAGALDDPVTFLKTVETDFGLLDGVRSLLYGPSLKL